jgi:hypothetical protein
MFFSKDCAWPQLQRVCVHVYEEDPECTRGDCEDCADEDLENIARVEGIQLKMQFYYTSPNTLGF